ncbi:unnamed protein product [Adineta steineri]|uniref:Serine/arginine-rich splicing factor 2 n=2 Tax=Adineta steineri TaxID=433720 RepID=A0A814BWL0_9BILA|nr:unnamed protein product [Adineta steineri]CAF0972061.1 unnamed protein product [Adineta steineri]
MSSHRSPKKSDRHVNLSQINTMHSLKVDNLAYRTRVVDLQRCFERFGPIGDIYVPRDQFSHSNRGYAFVRFLEKRDAQNAINRMDGADIDGREVRVQLARYNRGSGTNGRNKIHHRRSRSRSRSPRRSKHRSRSSSGGSPSRNNRRRSRSRSSRRSRSTSHSKRNNHSDNSEDEQPQEKK